MAPGDLDRPVLDQVDHHAPADRRRRCGRPSTDAVEDDPAVVDDQQPPAQLDDVAQVVGGEDDGRPLLAVELGQEVAHRRLGLDVEPDGGLVEEQHLGRGQHGRRQLAPHALAQRQRPHGHVQQRRPGRAPRRARPSAVEVGRPARRRAAATSWNESRSGRSHHSWDRWPNTTPIRRASRWRSPHGTSPSTATAPDVGTQDPAHHLHRGGLAGPVGPDVAHELARRPRRSRPRPRPSPSPGGSGTAWSARAPRSRRSRAGALVVADAGPPGQPGQGGERPQRPGRTARPATPAARAARGGPAPPGRARRRPARSGPPR